MSTINIYLCIVLSVLENIMWRQFCVVLTPPSGKEASFSKSIRVQFYHRISHFIALPAALLTYTKEYSLHLHTITPNKAWSRYQGSGHVTRVGETVYDTWRTWSRDHNVTWSTAREGSAAHLIQLFHIRNNWITCPCVTWPGHVTRSWLSRLPVIKNRTIIQGGPKKSRPKTNPPLFNLLSPTLHENLSRCSLRY